jgi:hypothetical protein
MSSIRGGLGEKTEDWVEWQHQEGGKARARFSRIRNLDLHANARAKTEQRDANASVIARIAEVQEATSRNFANKKETKDT